MSLTATRGHERAYTDPHTIAHARIHSNSAEVGHRSQEPALQYFPQPKNTQIHIVSEREHKRFTCSQRSCRMEILAVCRDLSEFNEINSGSVLRAFGRSKTNLFKIIFGCFDKDSRQLGDKRRWIVFKSNILEFLNFCCFCNGLFVQQYRIFIIA